MKTVTAKEARIHFSELLNEVYYGGEEILITRSKKPLVILTSAKREEIKTSTKKKQ